MSEPVAGCVPLTPYPFYMVLCGEKAAEHVVCSLDETRWRSVWVQEKTLLGWKSSSIFGHTLCTREHENCPESLEGLVQFIRTNKRTYSPGPQYRIVNRLGVVLLELP